MATRQSIRDRAEAALARTDALGVEMTRIFLTLDRKRILRDAENLDARLAAGESLPLAGLICSIKDLVDRVGERTTAGSRLLADIAPATVDARIVARLEAAGVLIFGRTNLTEFAYSGVGLNPHHGTPGCVFDRARIPGGSSSGAALSVAHGLCDVAIGTDTGGSVRIPAAVNGLVGIKPTASRVPLDGLRPLSPSMDSVGPLAKDLDTALRVLAVLADDPSLDPSATTTSDTTTSDTTTSDTTTSDSTTSDTTASDSTSSNTAASDAAIPDAGALTIGVPVGWLTNELEPAVASAWHACLATLEKAGATLVEIDLGWLGDIALSNKTIVSVEAHQQYADALTSLGKIGDPNVLERIRFAESVDDAARTQAYEARRESIDRFAAALADVDVIAAPTLQTVPPTMAEAKADFTSANASMLRNCSAINFVDGCSVTLPVALDAADGYPEGMPGAVMLAAARGEDAALLRAATALDRLSVFGG